MLRTLLDEQIPLGLKTALTTVYAVSVLDLGWSGVKNGELLRRTGAEGFSVFVTMDRSLRHQQNLRDRPFGVVLLRSRSSRLEEILPLVSRLIAAIEAVRPGELREVGSGDFSAV